MTSDFFLLMVYANDALFAKIMILEQLTYYLVTFYCINVTDINLQ